MPAFLRPSNPLLVRDEVGKAKATCYDLPPGHVPFGSCGAKDVESARDVIKQWVSHSPPVRREERMLNFRQFNKQAVKSRMCTVKDQGRLIREDAGLPEISPRIGNSRGPPKALPSDTLPHYTYGKVVRPSTPIKEVLANKWADEAEDELQEYYANALILKSNPPSARKIHLTQASKGHAARAKAFNEPPESKAMFKLSKFKNVPKRLDTFRPKAVPLDFAGLKCSLPLSESAEESEK